MQGPAQLAKGLNKRRREKLSEGGRVGEWAVAGMRLLEGQSGVRGPWAPSTGIRSQIFFFKEECYTTDNIKSDGHEEVWCSRKCKEGMRRCRF